MQKPFQLENTFTEVKVQTPLRLNTHWVMNYNKGTFLDENYPYAENASSWPITTAKITQKDYLHATR